MNPRRTIQFSIRSLLVLTVITGLCTAWCVDHRKQLTQIQRLEDRIIELEAPSQITFYIPFTR
jgi:hypothetical protein